MKLTKTDILSKNFFQLLIDGFKLFLKSTLIVIPFFFCFTIIPLFINSFLLADFIWENGFYYATSSFSFLFEGLFESFFVRTFLIIAFCLIAIYIYEKYTKDDTSLTQCFKKAINYKIFLVWLIYVAVIPILYSTFYFFVLLVLVLSFYSTNNLFLLLISRVINILLNSFFIFMIFTYSIRDNNSTLSKTKVYREGSYFKILIIMGIYVVIIEVFQFILSLFWNPTFSEFHSWYDINNRRYDLIILNNFILSLPVLILGTLQIALLTPLFANQVAKKQHIFETKVVGEGEKIYCQHCGKLIKTDEKFCLYCGKNIE